MTLLNTHELRDLLFGDARSIAADLGISAKSVMNWQQKKTTPPPAMIKLLRMRYGDLGGLMGKNWEGFCFGKDGLFYHPDFKYGFAAEELRALFFNRQEVKWYRAEFLKMRAKIAQLRAEVWAHQQVRALSGGKVFGRRVDSGVSKPHG